MTSQMAELAEASARTTMAAQHAAAEALRGPENSVSLQGRGHEAIGHPRAPMV